MSNNIKEPIFFRSQEEFRAWLTENHTKALELFVVFYKVNTGKPSMTWSQSVDQALCFGWIDGIRRSIDESRYQIRFTPRKKSSIWSTVNIKKMEELTSSGLMTEAGLQSFSHHTKNKSSIYSFERRRENFPPELENMFKSNQAAWQFFQSLAPSYQKISIHWVISAKQEATQIKRLQELIAESAIGTNRWKNNKYKK